MEITLLIMDNHGIVFLNFCGNPDFHTEWKTLWVSIRWLHQKSADLNLQCFQKRIHLDSAGQGLYLNPRNAPNFENIEGALLLSACLSVCSKNNLSKGFEIILKFKGFKILNFHQCI